MRCVVGGAEDPNDVQISLVKPITLPPSASFPVARTLDENFKIVKGHTFDLRATLDAVRPEDKIQIIDDYQTFVTNNPV